MRYLYIKRAISKYLIYSRKITPDNTFYCQDIGVNFLNKVTKRKLKVGEQIRIPEKEFAELFSNAETVK